MPSRKKKYAIPMSKAKVTDSKAKIMRIVKEEFTAADLARYCVDEPMVPAQEVLERLEAINRQLSTKKRK